MLGAISEGNPGARCVRTGLSPKDIDTRSLGFPLPKRTRGLRCIRCCPFDRIARLFNGPCRRLETERRTDGKRQNAQEARCAEDKSCESQARQASEDGSPGKAVAARLPAVVATVTRPAVSRNNSRAPATGSNVLSVSKRPNTHPAPPGGFEGSHMATWIDLDRLSPSFLGASGFFVGSYVP